MKDKKTCKGIKHPPTLVFERGAPLLKEALLNFI
ncbi:hypothetical protein BHO_0900072 (plasmid) [Borrelia hermsii YBT]|uniref:Uncharacterized protein n=1 Tax=Borrelia hermsii YBT TaxID=1313295 RepID=W5T3C7_BORHE|nr:hypothetical protein BHO_0900072 [Borrelia hermsii YBT]